MPLPDPSPCHKVGFRRWAACLPSALVVLLAGCAVGPKYVPPDLGDLPPDAYTGTRLHRDETSADPSGRVVDLLGGPWWTAFADSALDRLVTEALARNPQVDLAAARVLESRALLGGSKAARWPTVQATGSATRSKFTLAQFGGRGSVYNTLFSTTATARYELDLWGKLSRAEQAAFATVLASEQDRRTVVQTLVADIVRTWLQARELECQLALSRRTIANYEDNLRLVEQRYVGGLVPPVDVHLARQNLLAARAQTPQFEQELATARRRLEILAGRYPAGDPFPAAGRRTEQEDLCECEHPPPLPAVPTGLPSELLQRRPDIQAAEMRLRSANARIGESKASLLPAISIGGEAGYRAVELDELLKSSSSIWSLVANLAMPLLNRGAQMAQIEAAQARTAQAAAAYRAEVLNAFGEVEAALQEEASQRERLGWLIASASEASHSLELAESRYRRGLDNLLLTLSTQIRLYNAESERIRAERMFRTARVNLILALGGPWDPAPPAVVAP